MSHIDPTRGRYGMIDNVSESHLPACSIELAACRRSSLLLPLILDLPYHEAEPV
uniref:Uncharacterized protein n=1 Tax=Picea glauca TaxID=3330 RepID=A0A101M0T6_PICGL|nr:hypothetical protein ABT39_MTgene4277 [Picea glauca]QHR90545.1 hypothetical protein Q903MT_gene4570 [Picea sitchensis]